jgi:hypothetical protein
MHDHDLLQNSFAEVHAWFGAAQVNQRGSRTEFESGNTTSGESVKYPKRLRAKACDSAHI